MNIKEAYEILGVSENSTPDEIKKSFRKLAAKYHPDNKSTGNEDTFKKLNEANQLIESYRNAPSQEQFHGGGFPFNINDFFGGGFGHKNNQKQIVIEEIVIDINLSFRESILGCKKEISYDKRVKCEICDGDGDIRLNNGCKSCGGRGVIVTRQGNFVVQKQCDLCHGRIRSETCKLCNGDGGIIRQVNHSISIPGGITDDKVLRISGAGHFVGSFMGGDQYSNVHIRMHVEGDNDLSLDGNDVISKVDLNLLDAITGTKKTVKTIDGQMEVNIPALSKNLDKISIPNLGVNRDGNQIVIINVSYPKDTDKLIAALKAMEAC